MTEKLTTYDPAADLGSDEDIAIFMAEAFQTSNAAYVTHALGIVARAKGMAQIAGRTGLSREQLLPFVQREWQSHLEDDAGCYEGFGHGFDRQGSNGRLS